jgi:hypothetical protein
MAGQKALFAICWPPHQFFSVMLAGLFPLFFLELSAFFVCVETALWVLDGTTPIPTIAPYITRAKRPPSYLDRCLDWVNTTIDKGADSIAPCIRVRRGTRSFSTGAARYPQQVTHNKGMQRFPQPIRVISSLNGKSCGGVAEAGPRSVQQHACLF